MGADIADGALVEGILHVHLTMGISVERVLIECVIDRGYL